MSVKLVIVLPVLNDLPALKALIKDLESQFSKQRDQVELLVVDDGSSPPIDAVRDLAELGFSGRVIRLELNIGHQRAIAVALSQLATEGWSGDIVVMDSDGEDRASDIPKLLAALDANGCDAAVAQRVRRTEGTRFRVFYRAYKLIFRILTGKSMDFGNFIAMRGALAKRLSLTSSLWVHFPATLLASRERIERVGTDRGKRFNGKSKLSLSMLIDHGSRSFSVFSDIILARLILLSGGVIFLCILASVAAVGMKVAGVAAANWPTIVLVGSGGLILQSLIVCLICLYAITGNRYSSLTTPYAQFRQFIARIDDFDANSGR